MKKLLIICILIVTAVFVFFTGCVEEGAPTETSTQTTTPEQTILTPTPTPTPTATPTATPARVVAKIGYGYFDNKIFGYSLSYPSNWDITNTPISIKPGKNSLVVLNPKWEASTEASIRILVVNELEDAISWQYDEEKLDKITVNGREGVVYEDSGLRDVVFKVDNIYYVIKTSAQKEYWDKYDSDFNEIIDSFMIQK